MRQITEINEEFGMLDENGQINYLFNKYIGIDQQNPFVYNPTTFELVVNMRYLEEKDRWDLVPISEPLTTLHIIRGDYTEAYVQENYPDCYGKTVYQDATGHSLRLIDQDNNADATLTIWFD
jgi:hypothetical protein